MATWSLLKRWTPRELFPPPKYDDDEEEEDDDEEKVCSCSFSSN
jgi:hypothetical protein